MGDGSDCFLTLKLVRNGTSATTDEKRLMRCPVCGHQQETSGIGAMFCGPHRSESGYLTPAVAMREVEEKE